MKKVIKKIYFELKSVVGPEFVSDDPVICQAYSGGGYGKDLYDEEGRRPACVVLPKDVKEVQAIVKIANKYKVPFIPVSTFYIAYATPTKPNTIIIDLKRMDRLKIDGKNMYAIVEPYVTYAQLQTEAMKLGLYTTAPLCGAQASVLANHISFGMGQTGHRTGYGNQRILAVEWVLPNGEILRIGSAFIKEYFWGEGPGPDLRGLLRGYIGHMGGLGVVTKMAVKLFPLPFKGTPEPTGTTPHTTFTLPSDRFRWYILIYPTPEKAAEAMYEIGKAEIAAVCMRAPVIWRSIRRASSKEEFWDLWRKEKEEVKKTKPNVVRVLLVGFASRKQLEYEERVLEDIAKETGGILKRVSGTASGECFKPSYSVRAYLPGGRFLSLRFGFDSIDHALKFLKVGAQMKRKYIPPFIDDEEECGWIQSYDFGWHAHGELTFYYNSTKKDLSKAKKFEKVSLISDLRLKAYTGYQYPHTHLFLGPKMGRYHIILKKLEKAFDPNRLSNRGMIAKKNISSLLLRLFFFYSR